MSVLLTGTVTPYVSAMRAAARTTQTTARSIESDMRQAAARSTAAMSQMAQAAQAQASRAGAGFERMADRAGAEMSRLQARGSAALSGLGMSATTAAAQIGARFPQATARASAALSSIGGRASAAFGTASAAASSAAGVISSRWSAASSAVSARWSTASAVVSSAMGSASAIASSAGAAIAGRWSAAGAAISARWAAVGAAVSGAMAAASASASSAAGFAASRWAAAGAAVSGAFGSMRLAAFAAGASILGVATEGRKSLEVVRAASLGLVAVFGLAALSAAKFEKAMSEVRAVTNGNASDMKALSQAALDAGKATVYSATQAANAEAELARAGISTADIIGGALKGSLDLAASGQLELGDAAIISAQAMNAFKLSGRDVGHIADVISAGAGKSATNVHDMGMAFRQAALMSSQTGLSLEQTVGTLSLFAQNALTGSDAGTSLKVMLQRLVPQSKEAANTMDTLGFSAYDAQGNFIGLSALAENMKTSFSQLTPEARNAAMATIFGSDAVRAATILYQAGSQGVDQWVQSVNDSGYATRVAATMTDNLAGDLERLKGSLETALISSGSSANGVLRDMAQALNSVVNWYSQLSPQMQTSVTVMAGLVGVVGFLGSSLLLMLPRIMAVRAELVALGVTAARVRTVMMGLGRLSVVVAGIAAISWGVGKLTESFRAAPPDITRLTNALVDFSLKGQATGEFSKKFGKDLDGIGEAAARLAHPGVLERIGDSLYTITHFGGQDAGLEEARDKIKSLDQALSDLVRSGSADVAAKAFERMSIEAEKQGTSTEKLKTLLPQYADALTATDTQAKLAAGSQKDLAASATLTADQMKDERSEAEKLTDALKTLNGAAISVAEKEIAFQGSLHDLTDAVKENGHSLDVTTEKGRAVKGAFLDAAQAAMAHAEAVAEQSGTIQAGNAVLEQDIQVLKRQMIQAGFSTQAVNDLIGKYAQMPVAVTTEIKADTAKAVSDLQGVQAEIRKTNGKSVTIDALTAQAEKNLRDLGFNVQRLPDGHVTVSIPTGPPSAAISAIQGRINSIQGRTVGVGVYLKATSWDQDANGVPDMIQSRRNGGLVSRYASGGRVQRFPTGGAVAGPGSGTSDSIPALISNGEYVIKASSVRQFGVGLFDRLNAGQATAYTARPADRFGPGGGGGQPVQQITKHYTINLYGAKQSGAEQAAEIQRALSFAT